MTLLRFYLARVVALVALPLVVAQAHVAKVLILSVAGNAPRQRMAFGAFVVLWPARLQCGLQQFYPFAQCLQFGRSVGDAFPCGPFAQKVQNSLECAHA